MHEKRVKKSVIAHCMNMIDEMPNKDVETLELSRTLFLETINSLQVEKSRNRFSEYVSINKKTYSSMQKIGAEYLIV